MLLLFNTTVTLGMIATAASMIIFHLSVHKNEELFLLECLYWSKWTSS